MKINDTSTILFLTTHTCIISWFITLQSIVNKNIYIKEAPSWSIAELLKKTIFTLRMANNGTIRYCNKPQCKICRHQILDTSPTFISNLAQKTYNINTDATCDTINCIYKISCKAQNCRQSYIGFTTTKLNKRLSGHRANILNGTESHIILNHFTKHHQISDMIIKPIDICDKEILRNKETFWMQELNTVFPYGLNNRINISNIQDAHEHVINNNDTPIYSIFNTVKNNRTKKGSKKRNNVNNIP